MKKINEEKELKPYFTKDDLDRIMKGLPVKNRKKNELKLSEVFKVTFQHLPDIQNLKLYNPIGKRGVKIFKERKGVLCTKENKFHEGTYYVYNHKAAPKKFMCVFVPKMIGEGDTVVHPIAIDKSLPKVLSRMAYRFNTSKRKYVESKNRE